MTHSFFFEYKGVTLRSHFHKHKGLLKKLQGDIPASEKILVLKIRGAGDIDNLI